MHKTASGHFSLNMQLAWWLKGWRRFRRVQTERGTVFVVYSTFPSLHDSSESVQSHFGGFSSTSEFLSAEMFNSRASTRSSVCPHLLWSLWCTDHSSTWPWQHLGSRRSLECTYCVLPEVILSIEINTNDNMKLSESIWSICRHD